MSDKFTLQDLINETLFGIKKKKTVKEKVSKKTENKKQALGENKTSKNITTFARDFWWVKKGKYYGLATFSDSKFISDMPAVAAAGLAKAIVDGEKPDQIFKDFQDKGATYAKPILIKWLVTPEDIKEAGVKDYFEFINKNSLPLSVTPDKDIVVKIQKIIREPFKQILGDKNIDELSEDDINKIKELETKIIDNLKELPIELPNKKLTKTETEKVKKMMSKGTNPNAKYAEANIGTVIKNEDIPVLIEIAKKKLG